MSAEIAYPPSFELLLASRSPRRTELLSAAGVPHRVVETRGREGSSEKDPVRLARENALEKARHAVVPSDASERAFVLGTDTVVVLEGRVLEKPAGRGSAAEMLESLSGRRHQVVSGVAVMRRDRSRTPGVASEVTTVAFRALEAEEIDAYLDGGEWEDKAGAYAIQGRAAFLIERIEGDYANVVGLPLRLLALLVKDLGFDLVTARWGEVGNR